ncbi:hypothetical protein CJ230_08610 [Oligella urethralis]|uniref:TRAP transporter small permease n=1 Tax=Oligella urethralis TaxID=90245 RepID=UPI000C9A457D|nr:TRAP transporter small permease [Oligella urethralis]PMC16655.1 hypothetical protein CJ230_08610 [Oligella urethralis]
MSDQNSLLVSKSASDSDNIYRCLVRKLCKLGLTIATVLLLACTALVGVNIIMRYGFHSSILGTEELVSAALTIIVMLSTPEVLRRHSHIGVDILVGLLPNRFKKIASIWSSALVLVVAAILIINGWNSMQLSKLVGVLTEGYIEIPVWTLQLFLPIGGVMMALVAIEQLFRPQVNNSDN